MVWAQKNTTILAVGVSYRTAAHAVGPAFHIYCSSFGEARAALESGAYSALVVDRTVHAADARSLVEYARALHPNIRVIFSARRSPTGVPLSGDLLVAGNGRQFVRGLRSMLGC